MDKINIIWNLTRLCPFRCSFCCVSAVNIKGFKQIDDNDISKYNELSYDEKIQVIEQLKVDDFSIDFSGGDVLINQKNLDVIKFASERLGKENIGLSIPGTFLDKNNIEFIEKYVNDVELSLDSLPDFKNNSRELSYSEVSISALKKIEKYKINIGVQTVINKNNISKKNIFQLYQFLNKSKINKWSILRFFPVGNFYGNFSANPSISEYLEIREYIESITKESNIEVHFQYLYPNKKSNFKCRAVKKSIGINPEGKVSSCFWAIDKKGNPIDDFYLGDVPKENLYNILNTSRSIYWKNQSKLCNVCRLYDIIGNDY